MSSETIEELSEKIKTLTKYGLRKEEVKENGYIFTWSNAAKSWWMSHVLKKKGSVVELDANQFIGYLTKEEGENLVGNLPELPLYKNSFEYFYKKV